MSSDLTTKSADRRAAESRQPATVSPYQQARYLGDRWPIALIKLLGALLLGALLLALLYQIPATHAVDIGGYDAAYVQGFYDAERTGSPDLAGSDGSARWTHEVSDLLFPQAGLPAQVTLRLRGPSGQPAHDVVVLLNGVRELGRLRPGAAWEEHTFTIDDGLLKLSDVVIELRSTIAPLSASDPRPVGVLLDRATYRTSGWPIVPYPAQLAYAALATGMLYILLKNRRTAEPLNRQPEIRSQESGVSRRSLIFDLRFSPAHPLTPSPAHPLLLLGLLGLGIAFLFLYRLQPPYPYPLRRLLPMVDLALAALLALRDGPALVRRAPVLLDGLALGALGVWTVALLLAARNHVTLSTPSVENDFGVFARRSAQLAGVFQPSGEYSSAVDGVLRADGFYNLGYPLLLWLVRPLAQGNPFLAAQLISALSGALLLGAAWWLARPLGRRPALLALLMLALSPLVVEYGLYVGTDMLFAALCTLALALLITGHRPPTTDHHTIAEDRGSRIEDRSPAIFDPRSSILSSRFSVPNVVLAGLAAGAAFLVRHPGLLLLPLGWLALWRRYESRVLSSELNDQHAELNTQHSKLRTRSIVLFTLAFLLAIAPQLIVNIRDTGQPLYSQQAKNVWLCVYGSCDWGRWDEAPNGVTLSEIVLRDPGRFLANWWANMRGFFGTGAEDTSEFGHAIQLRLLGFPANWLALAGLLAWLAAAFRNYTNARKQGDPVELEAPAHPLTRSPAHLLTLLLWVALYVLTVSVGISLPRFFLPLAPIYAIAAAWLVAQLEPQNRGSGIKDQGSGIGDRGSEIQEIEDQTTQNSKLKTQNFSLPFTRSPAHLLTRSLDWSLAGCFLLLLILWGGFAAGAGYVLGNQPADEVAAVQLAQATLRPGQRLVVRAPPRLTIGQYSAIAHLAVPEHGQYLLALGGDAPAGSTIVGVAGQFTLYRLAP